VNRSALAASAKASAPPAPADAPPPSHKPPLPDQPNPASAGSAEDLGSAALEHRLDKLEKDIESSPP